MAHFQSSGFLDWFHHTPLLHNRLLKTQQLVNIPWSLPILLGCISFISLILLYSAGKGFSPWCVKQMVRFVLGFTCMFGLAMTPIRLWYSFAYLFYGGVLFLLFLTDVMGIIGMGAQRWINLFTFQFQPSEFMRIAVVLALARYFHDNPIRSMPTTCHSKKWTKRFVTSWFGNWDFKNLIWPMMMIAGPVLLTIRQPDLGTAMLLIFEGAGLFFLVGVNFHFFLTALFMFIIGCPFFWMFLHDYQRNRILMFLNPASDPLGAGYHIIQSKIAIGSGGFWGKGFLAGTQSTLNFLPEKHTDFIFTLLSEEFGLLGVLLLLALYITVIALNISLSLQIKDQFRRNVVLGLTLSFTFYALINIAMVVGFLPVVGIPLPLVSYGGSSLVTIMGSFGIILSSVTYQAKQGQLL